MTRRWPWVAGFAAAAALAVAAAWTLYDSLFPIFLGFGLAYALYPLANRLEAGGLGRTRAVLAILGAGMAVMLLFAFCIVPSLLEDAQALARVFPRHLEAVVRQGLAWAQALGLPLPQGREALLARARAALEAAPMEALSPAGRFLGRFFSGAAGFLVGSLNLLIMPLVLFHFLRDLAKIRQAVLRQVPPRHRRAFESRLDEADAVFSGYLRGQMTVALTMAAFYAAALSLAGINFGLVIGALAGLLNVVPYVGVTTGLLLSLTMALVDFSSWGKVGLVLGIFAAGQSVEGLVLTPRVVGNRVGLNLVETILALIVGGQLAGLAGMALAIPMGGCLKVYLRDALAAYRRSEFFTAP